ncbi:hypothetical protein J6590_027366 [Homalodisca vitripennis]|nr:hypothetical protein J6590_027366 [Homalodisca vitripennis]
MASCPTDFCLQLTVSEVTPPPSPRHSLRPQRPQSTVGSCRWKLPVGFLPPIPGMPVDCNNSALLELAYAS